MASREPSPTASMPRPMAIPWARESPIRSPVKDPGPATDRNAREVATATTGLFEKRVDEPEEPLTVGVGGVVAGLGE